MVKKVELLKKLTEEHGAPGFEHAIRAIMRDEIEKIGATIVTDRLGSIFGKVDGSSQNVTVMLAGHMDEVAFMVSEITKEGYLRFVPLGGWWSQVLLSQRLAIITDKKTYTGVIGSKPPHILQPEERNAVYPMREMFIDVGAKSKEQVKNWGIKVGDPIVPICPFEILPDHDTILAKALDNRIGCWLAVEVLKALKEQEHPNTVFAGATVQEEVGLRGASTSPYVVEPDVAFALDVGVAEDGPGGNSNKAKLGHGPLITFLDSSMVPNTKLRNFVIEVAEEHNIPYQVDVMLGGGTDGGKFHLHKKGVPTLVIGAASRYIHSHTSMVSKQDLENGVKLLTAVIKRLDEQTFKTFLPQ
ncbi:M42 family metallopeptidase [Priestia megaterium]|nr:M42 family metallopeptidase [Priestia megaterium]